MRRRRKSRILAVSMLYGMELSEDYSIGHARTVLGMFRIRFEQNVEEYAFHLVRGVMAQRKEVDAMIREYARNWKYNRMAVVDRQIMRVALWEMLYDRRTPPPVCINEAIDIAKLYSTSESGHFINGILDNVRKGAPAAEPDSAAHAARKRDKDGHA